MSQSHPRICWA